MGIKRRAVAMASLITGTVAFTLAGPAAAASPPLPSDALSSAEKALLTSDRPLDIVIDPANGRLMSVKVAQEAISNHNYCNAKDGCFLSGKTPWAHQGCYGTKGTYRGSWPYRSGYYTGKYTASACWQQACSQRSLPPNTRATFGGTLVTGTSFTIH